MSEPRKPGVTLDQSAKRRAVGDRLQQRRSPGERFAHLSDRLARSLPAMRSDASDDHHDGELAEATIVHDVPVSGADGVPEPYDQAPAEGDDLSPWYEETPRFPIVRNGYDCPAVDQHVAQLEHDLAELEREAALLRTRARGEEEVRAEIRRIGEQTSAILVEAHNRANETTSEAEEMAQRLITDANRQAQQIAEETERRRAEIQRDTDALGERRDQLVADLDALAAKVAAVAREASGRSVAPQR